MKRSCPGGERWRPRSCRRRTPGCRRTCRGSEGEPHWSSQSRLPRHIHHLLHSDQSVGKKIKLQPKSISFVVFYADLDKITFVVIQIIRDPLGEGSQKDVRKADFNPFERKMFKFKVQMKLFCNRIFVWNIHSGTSP